MKQTLEMISTVYPLLKEQEKMHEMYRHLLEEKFRQSGSEIATHHGMVFHFQKHTKWSWRDSIYDALEEECKLPLCVSIPKAVEERFELEGFLLPAEKSSVRIYPTRKTKAQSEIEKERFKQLEMEYRQFPFEQLASRFVSNKLDLAVSEQKYESLKQKLYTIMLEQQTKSLASDVGTFKIVDGKSPYDVHAISFSEVMKKHAFLSLTKEEGTFLLNLFTGATQQVTDSIVIDGQLFWYENGDLFCDGTSLDAPSFAIDYSNDVALTMSSWLTQGAQFHYGKTPISGMHFFRHCPISSVKLDELLDRGLLEQKLVEQSRFCAKEEDITLRFEAIDESSLAERKTMFHNKLLRRAMVKMERDKEVREVIEDDIFAS